MNPDKRKRLEAKGWKVGNTEELLGLSPEESSYIEVKLALSKGLQEMRILRDLTQEQVAQMLKSSQSRVAKMESGDPSVSLDLIIKSLLVLGASKKSLARLLK
jgi:DNA-binding XRE family transcriptional regulator